MIIICNGAPKSGSSWLVQIAKSLPGAMPVPENVQNPKFNNSSLRDECVFDFLNGPAAEGLYYSKHHWRDEAWHREVLAHPNVRMLNIVRDVRDVIVSFYYHNVRMGRTDAPFELFFKRSGASLARKNAEYHRFWHEKAPEPLLVSYEGLKFQFDTVIAAILDYLDIPSVPSLRHSLMRTDALHKESRLETGDGKFWRKASIADWQNHLTQKMQREIHDVCIETGYYDLLLDLRRRYPHLNLIYAN